MSAIGNAIRDGGQWIVLAGAVLAAVAYIGRSVWRTYKAASGFFARLDRALLAVESQLYPNHSTSLRDAVDRIQEHLGITNFPPERWPDSKEID